ncbi:MAG: glycosyltransferase [Nostoc sp.]|uniref:glycosyltransferase n=1 Tax=Nostoc sp. TaxID=1180 RepID=UPI002FFD138F
MKILVSLPRNHQKFNSIDSVLDGTASCSGTDGAIIRMAGMLSDAGIDVTLSSAVEIESTKLTCVKHDLVDAGKFDNLVVHQSHWNGNELTFGNQSLSKTFLWLQNRTSWSFVSSFLNKGGNRIICPSISHANVYRAVPQWARKVNVVYNSYCPAFKPTLEQQVSILLFVGAVTPSKGFVELMQVWSHLVQQEVNLQLAVAGSLSLHQGSKFQQGSLGVASSEFENNYIQPWLKTLPEKYQPDFLGALSPESLQKAIGKSWAVIVNPSWNKSIIETFCVAAVDAQACDRTVFSLAEGGLKETVYRGKFKSLANEQSTEALSKLIINGLAHNELVLENGKLAGEFVRNKFGTEAICKSWIALLSGQQTEPVLPKNWESTRDFWCDILRSSGTSRLISQYR